MKESRRHVARIFNRSSRLTTAFLVLVLLASPSPAEPGDPNEFDVLGQRREHERDDRPGLSDVVRPIDATRFDTKAQLDADSALSSPETGRVSASGFAVPRIRGQDTRLTEIYVEDLLLQDPYSGLPLVDEIDLRAFGELAIHEGVSPIDLATVNPVGALRYRIVPARTSGANAGATIGAPFGSSIWILGQYRSESGEAAVEEGDRFPALAARAYVRQHRTNGRYTYYDDHATPYNGADDRYLSRENNDRVSRTAMPAFSLVHGPDRLSFLALWQDADGGLAADSPIIKAQARSHAASNFASLAWTRQLSPALASTTTIATTEDLRSIRDPAAAIFTTTDATKFKAESRRARVRLEYEEAKTRVRVEVGGARAIVGTAGAFETMQALSRETYDVYAGATTKIITGSATAIDLEIKGLARRLEDKVATSGGGPAATIDAATKESGDSRRQLSQGTSLTLGLSGMAVKPYLQIAAATRPPSLLEEFGDAATVRGNQDLKQESARHYETGVAVISHDRQARAGLSLFADDAKDRLTFTPSLGQTMRAQNLGKTATHGLSVNGEFFYRDSHPFANVTWLTARDISSDRTTHVLPSIPERQAALGIEEGILRRMVTVRWTSRYRSDVFLDTLSSIQSPGYWLHDASVDWHAPSAKSRLSAGLAVLNVANLTRVPIQAVGGGANDAQSNGETALANVDGYPLPGRQWRLSIDFAL